MIKQYELKKLDPEGKIYLGIPRERMYIPYFVDNRDQILMELQKASKSVGFYQAEGHRVDRNRDRISEVFLELKEKPEWLQMIDSDMDHPRNLPLRLVKHAKPIVGGLYFHRNDTHDPFVFKEVGPRPDKYGRMCQMWMPLRDLVYDFLTENGVPYIDGAITIDDCKNPPLVECDAVATGAMMIHRSVLETMEAPIFEYRAGGISEDMMFCYEAKHDYGIPIFCDLSTISGHYVFSPQGQGQFRFMYEKRGVNFSGYTKGEAIEWLAEFLGIAKELATEKIEKGNAHMVSDYWLAQFNNRTPKPKEVDRFYKDPYTGQLYLIELLHWNFSPVFYNIKSLFSGLKGKDVLEFGSGIGSIAIQLAVQHNNVVAIEPNETLREFAKLRETKIRNELTTDMGTIEYIDDLKGTPENAFNAVTSVDVFEHLTPEDLPNIINELGRVLKMGGDLIYHANFGQQDLYPMHYDHNDIWDATLIQAGFMPLSPTHAIKVR